MKVRSITRKPIFNDLLALALACTVSLLFTQNNVQFYKTSQVKTVADSFAVPLKKESSEKSQSGNAADEWSGNVAVLNNSSPIFQIRDDSWFIIKQSVSQHVTANKQCRNTAGDSHKISCSRKSLSITILHRQLII